MINIKTIKNQINEVNKIRKKNGWCKLPSDPYEFAKEILGEIRLWKNIKGFWYCFLKWDEKFLPLKRKNGSIIIPFSSDGATISYESDKEFWVYTIEIPNKVWKTLIY